MEMKKNLPKGTMFTAKNLGYMAKKSEAMKRLMQNKTIAGALDKSVERKEFFAVLKEETGGKNVKKEDMRKVLGYFRSGHGKNIDKSEAQKIAGQIFNGTYEKKYIFSPEKKSASAPVSLLMERKERKERSERKIVPLKRESSGTRGLNSPSATGKPISRGSFVQKPSF